MVIDGLPAIPGATILDRRHYARQHLDHLRRALMWEPRGHADMYGGWILPPTSRGGDLSVLFLHNEGFSTMCGHGIIALAKVLLDTGAFPATGAETVLRIDTPAGLIESTSEMAGGVTVGTRFTNVPSFVSQLGATVMVPGLGDVEYDLSFGGAFYAIVDAMSLGLDLENATRLIPAGRAIKQAITASREIEHPESDDLGFLYGVIFTGPPADGANHSRNVCVFADGEVDRSPTGTGLSARLAIMFQRGEVGVGDSLTIESIVGSEFTGRVAGVTRVGSRAAIVPEISGSAHLTGRSEIWLDPNDRLGGGFLVR